MRDEAIQLEAPEAFAIGDRIYHVKYGGGTVTAIEGRQITVSFDRHAPAQRKWPSLGISLIR
jgi:hypothetical protein